MIDFICRTICPFHLFPDLARPPPRCYGHAAPWEVCEEAKSRTAGALLSESLTDFATKLYSKLREAKPTDNMLFSPVSIAGVLSHLLLGML